MNLSKQCSFELPDWIGHFLDGWTMPLMTISRRMQLAIALSAENVRQGTGGPFAAVVINEETRELVAVGVNLVISTGLSAAHAEIVALSLAQTAVNNWNLADAGTLQLVTTCEPCAMCYGAVPWSGVKSLVCGAGQRDAEAAGFDEGEKPADWVKSLQQRGIVVQCGVLSEEAAAVLADYKAGGGLIYNAD